MQTFTHIDKTTIMTEPVTIMMWAFVFEDELYASAVLPGIAEFYRDYIAQMAKIAPSTLNERSIGRVGDDRHAYFDDSGAPMFAAIVRVGRVIQVSFAMAVGGDTTGYMADVLATIVPATDSDPAVFIPDIADMPTGWEVLWDDPIDITAGARGK